MIQIGHGAVYHTRKSGYKNNFRYPSYFIFFDTQKTQSLNEQFKKQFYRLLSLDAKNYLEGGSADIDTSVRHFLQTRCDYQAETVLLHTMPKVLGYVFNPVSFWFCKKQGIWDGVLVEVNNTFGERHFYWLHVKEGINPSSWYKMEKMFHVSPFFPVDGFYKFQFEWNPTMINVEIHHHAPDGALRLATGIRGELKPLHEETVSHVLGKYGWITLLVILRIHWQALILWLNKTRFYKKPPLPKNEVTS